MAIWSRLKHCLPFGEEGRRTWKSQKGPLHSDVFRKLNTLQLHAPLDKKERCRLRELQSRAQQGRSEEKSAKRVRQFLNVLVGVAVGVVAWLMRQVYKSLEEWRKKVVLGYLGEDEGWHSAAIAALVASAITATLGLVASALVAWQPAAASSGIPGVIAYLNGVDLNHALTPRVLAAKILGTVLAVGSGLAVGPEGPMIHIGAMVGRFCVHCLLRPALRLRGQRGRMLQDELKHQPLRYDVQAAAMGAGAGIAAAFSAPLAGTVFVVEEAASFFSKRLFLHTFITCAAALATTMCLDLLTGSEIHHFYTRTDCSSQHWSMLLLIQIALIGVLCGLLGYLFNRFVVLISRAMAKEAYELGQCWKLRLRRFAVVVVISVLCGASGVIFVASRPCANASLQQVFESSSGCLPEEWMWQLTQGAHSVRAAQSKVDWGFNRKPETGPNALAFIPVPGLFGAQYDPVLCPQALNATGGRCRIPGIEKHLDPKTGLREEHYCCGFTSLVELNRSAVFSFQRPVAPLAMSKDSWPQAACPQGHHDAENSVWIEHYSPAAALTFVAPSVTVRNLLVRGAPNVLPAGDLVIFTLGYGALTILSTGAWVPGGLLVPMMTIGAGVGRIWGLLWDLSLSAFEGNRRRPPVPWIPEWDPLMDLLYHGAKDPSPGLPPEPGVLALAGCAAFLAGSGALALFVIVLLIEVTLEPFLIPVVIIAVLCARGMASLLHSHGLYHELMEVQSLPFLSEHHHWRQEHCVVTDVLREDYAVWQRRRHLEEAEGGTPEMGRQTSTDWTLYEAVAEVVAAESRIGDSRTSAPSVEDLQEAARELLVTVHIDANKEEVEELLEKNPMVNGFPVVGEDGRLCGLATRGSLAELVEGDGNGSPAASIEPGVASGPLSGAAAPLADAEHGQVVLPPVGVDSAMDSAPFVVPDKTHLKHAHMLFYKCGLRHLVVVDSHFQPVGLLTRKSLMPWRIPAVPGAEEGHGDTFVESRRAHTPIHTPPSSPQLNARSLSRRSYGGEYSFGVTRQG